MLGGMIAILLAAALATAPLAEEGTFKHDKRDGVWTRYFPNGHKAQVEVYRAGLRVGHWAKWFEDGKLSEEGDFANDKRDGAWSRYFPDGKRGELEHFQAGLRVGQWAKWYDNGK